MRNFVKWKGNRGGDGEDPDSVTHGCSIHEERVKLHEETSTFFGAGLFVHVSVEVTQL